MRKWVALGVLALGLVWLAYLVSSRPAETRASEDTDSAGGSAPPLTAAAPVALNRPASAPAPSPPTSAWKPEPPAPPVPDRNVLFAKRFDSETRDAFWANDQEPALKTQLSEIELKDENVSAVECRRTVCRVTFKHPRLNEGQAINLYSRALTTFGDVQLANHDAGSDQPAHFYTLRKGYTLDPPQ